MKPDQQQLELFTLAPRKEWTRAIPLYDALPKFLFGSARRFEPGEPVMSHVATNLRLPDGNIYDLTITPGNVAALPSEDGESASSRRPMEAFLPGEREELVARAIRYLSTQELTPMGEYVHKTEGPSLRVTFTLHQIIQLLRQWGHTFNSKEIDESLFILSSASLNLFQKGSRKAFFRGSIFADYTGVDDSDDPRDQRRQVVLNRLEYQAICAGAYHALNFQRLMRLEGALARRLFEYLVLTNRNASKPPKTQDAEPPPPIKFTSNDVLTYCGITPQKKFRQTLERIRKAIVELGESGSLWKRNNAEGAPVYFDEFPTYSKATGGRRSVEMVTWHVWFSADTVQEMIASHTEALPYSDTFTNQGDPVIKNLSPQQKQNMRKKGKDALASRKPGTGV